MAEIDDQELVEEVEEKRWRGSYVNVARVNHTQWEFFMDFYHAFPIESERGTQVRKPLVTRVILSPHKMRALLQAMLENIELYEKQYGESLPVRPEASALPSAPGWPPAKLPNEEIPPAPKGAARKTSKRRSSKRTKR